MLKSKTSRKIAGLKPASGPVKARKWELNSFNEILGGSFSLPYLSFLISQVEKYNVLFLTPRVVGGIKQDEAHEKALKIISALYT